MKIALMSVAQARLQADLSRSQQLAERFESLAEHRRKQLDDLHALALEHNKRLKVDVAKLEFYQSKIEELTDYINEQMADRDAVCLDLDDARRLHQLWNDNSSPYP